MAVPELGMQDKIKLLGAQSHERIGELLRSAHLFLHPSVTTRSGCQEGPCNSIYEAMATGLPVVSTLHGGIVEVVEDGKTGFLVPERDVAALQEKLCYLIDHPERWQEMGRAGRERAVRLYEREMIENKLEQILTDLMGDTNRMNHDTDGPLKEIN